MTSMTQFDGGKLMMSTPSSKLQSTRHPGFQLVGDNIDFITKPRHQTSEHGKKNLHYFNFLAVKNKVNVLYHYFRLDIYKGKHRKIYFDGYV